MGRPGVRFDARVPGGVMIFAIPFALAAYVRGRVDLTIIREHLAS